MPLSRREFAFSLAAAGRSGFSFGLVADVQYADKPAAGKREYRKSLEKLETCRSAFSAESLAFVAQLGDLVDEGVDNLDAALAVWKRMPARGYHVIGNHDGAIDRKILHARLGLQRGWYRFTHNGWRFVVLDSLDASVSTGWLSESEHARAGAEMLAGVKARKEKNASDWNGGIGRAQLRWLGQTLVEARAKGERAILFCHAPVLAESCRPEHLIWNHAEVLDVVTASGAAAAWFNGHDHRGGYGQAKGVHFMTLPGLVENDPAVCATVVEVESDALIVRRAGEKSGKRLTLAPLLPRRQ